jgi:hypothetical protein
MPCHLAHLPASSRPRPPSPEQYPFAISSCPSHGKVPPRAPRWRVEDAGRAMHLTLHGDRQLSLVMVPQGLHDGVLWRVYFEYCGRIQRVERGLSGSPISHKCCPPSSPLLALSLCLSPSPSLIWTSGLVLTPHHRDSRHVVLARIARPSLGPRARCSLSTLSTK